MADIRKSAGQHNSSVIAYYFGTKEGLLRAVLAHRLPAVDADRSAVLDEIRRTKGSADCVRDMLWAIARPLANTIGRNCHYVALLDQLAHHDRLTDCWETTDPASTTCSRRIDGTLRALLEDLPDDIVEVRLELLYSGILRTLARYDRCGRQPTTGELAGLVDAWEAMLLAPMSAETAGVREPS